MAFTPVALSENLAAEVSHTLPHHGTFAYDLLYRLEGNTFSRLAANQVVVRTGRDIREPILVQSTSSVKRLNGPMDSAPLVGFMPDMTLRDVWKDYGQLLVIDENELEDNAGAEKILDVLQMKRDFAIKQMQKELNDDLVYSGADNHMNSLHYHVSATPGSGPTLHGYAPASYSFMQNIQVTGGSFASGVGEAALMEAVETAAKAQNVDKVKWLVSARTPFLNFQKAKIGIQQINLTSSANGVSTAGEISFMGIPWHYDIAYPDTTTVIGVQPDFVKLYSKGRSMSFSAPMDVVDQWFSVWKMKMRMQLMFLNLARQFKVTALSA